MRAAAAGLLVFLVCAARFALLGLGQEAGMVETESCGVQAASGRRGCRRSAMGRLGPRRFPPAERRGTAAVAAGRGRRAVPGGGDRRDRLRPVLPDFVTPLGEVLGGVVIFGIDHVSDVSWELT